MLEYLIFAGLMGATLVIDKLRSQKLKIQRDLNIMLRYYLNREYDRAISAMEKVCRESSNRSFINLYNILNDKKGLCWDYSNDRPDIGIERAIFVQEQIVKFLENTKTPRIYRTFFDYILAGEKKDLMLMRFILN